MYSKIATALVLSVFATSASAAANRPEAARAVQALAISGSFNTLSATEDSECPRVVITGTFTVTGTEDEGGGAETIAVNVWDDGNFITSVTAAVPVGATQTYAFSISYSGTVLNGAAGVGVYLEDAVGPAATQTFAANGNLAPTFVDNCPPVGNSITLLADGQAVPVGPAAAGLMAGAIGVLGALRRRRAAKTE